MNKLSLIFVTLLILGTNFYSAKKMKSQKSLAKDDDPNAYPEECNKIWDDETINPNDLHEEVVKCENRFCENPDNLEHFLCDPNYKYPEECDLGRDVDWESIPEDKIDHFVEQLDKDQRACEENFCENEDNSEHYLCKDYDEDNFEDEEDYEEYPEECSNIWDIDWESISEEEINQVTDRLEKEAVECEKRFCENEDNKDHYLCEENHDDDEYPRECEELWNIDWENIPEGEEEETYQRVMNEATQCEAKFCENPENADHWVCDEDEDDEGDFDEDDE